jgi:hypothetical protein
MLVLSFPAAQTIKNPLEAFQELETELMAFMASPEGRRIRASWRHEHPSARYQAVCDAFYVRRGITSTEYWHLRDEADAFLEAQDDTYFRKLDHEHGHSGSVGPQVCGWCGGEFKNVDALHSHEAFCSFAPGGGISIEAWRGKE